jgi:quinol monooxygenase YgiN
MWFEWSRSVDDSEQYVLIEAFTDEEAGVAHVRSEHFAWAAHNLPAHLQETPRIVNVNLSQDDWSLLGELTVDPHE